MMRKLLTAVGEDPDYGFNLIRLLSVGLDPTKIRAYIDLAQDECLKDDRVDSVTITIEPLAGSTFNIFVYGRLKTGLSYSLVMPLTSDTLAQLSTS